MIPNSATLLTYFVLLHLIVGAMIGAALGLVLQLVEGKSIKVYVSDAVAGAIGLMFGALTRLIASNALRSIEVFGLAEVCENPIFLPAAFAILAVCLYRQAIKRIRVTDVEKEAA